MASIIPLAVVLFCPFVSALPTSGSDAFSRMTPPHNYTRLIIICLTFFLVFGALLAAKLIYLKHRRIGTIHAPNLLQSSVTFSVESHSSLSTLRKNDYATTRFRVSGHGIDGILVGCFGSPAWETRIKSKIDQETWKETKVDPFFYTSAETVRDYSSRGIDRNYRGHSFSGRAGQSSFASLPGMRPSSTAHGTTWPCRSKSTRLPVYPPKARGKTFLSRNRFSLPSLRLSPRSSGLITDFGEKIYEPTTCTGQSSRLRFSRSSLLSGNKSPRLVGTTVDTEVPASLLSASSAESLLSSTVASSSSLQLSRSFSKYNRKPVPPVPPLPSLIFDRPSLLHQSSNISGDTQDHISAIPLNIPCHPYATYSPSQCEIASASSVCLPNENQTISINDLELPIPKPLPVHPIEYMTSTKRSIPDFVEPTVLPLDLTLFQPPLVAPDAPPPLPTFHWVSQSTSQRLHTKTTPTSKKSSRKKPTKNSKSVASSASSLRDTSGLAEDKQNDDNKENDPIEQSPKFVDPTPISLIEHTSKPVTLSAGKLGNASGSAENVGGLEMGCSPISHRISTGRHWPVADSFKAFNASPATAKPRDVGFIDMSDSCLEMDIGLHGLHQLSWPDQHTTSAKQSNIKRNTSNDLVSFWDETGWVRGSDQWDDGDVGLAW